MDSKTQIRMNYFIFPFVVVFFMACGGKDSAMDADYTQFKIEDTASIQKIQISNNGEARLP